MVWEEEFYGKAGEVVQAPIDADVPAAEPPLTSCTGYTRFVRYDLIYPQVEADDYNTDDHASVQVEWFREGELISTTDKLSHSGLGPGDYEIRIKPEGCDTTIVKNLVMPCAD